MAYQFVEMFRILPKLLRVTRHCGPGLWPMKKLVHVEHFPCHIMSHHVLAMFEKSDIMSDKVSYIKPSHAGHF